MHASRRMIRERFKMVLESRMVLRGNINKMRFTDSHEWVQLQDDGSLLVGITDFAQISLGDLVYVELPDVGDVIEADEECAFVESSTAASEVYCPVAGQVLEVNEALLESPGLINISPCEQGWMFRLLPDNSKAFEALLSERKYKKLVSEEAH
jgi:glycine cleavage system H protein